jgi:hypothetical protein
MAPQSVISTTLQLLRDQASSTIPFLAHPLIRAIEDHGNLIKVSWWPASRAARHLRRPLELDHPAQQRFRAGQHGCDRPVSELRSSSTPTSLQPIVLSAVEKAANKGDLAVVNILESKMKNVMLSAQERRSASRSSQATRSHHQHPADPQRQRHCSSGCPERHRLVRGCGTGHCAGRTSVGRPRRRRRTARQNWFNQSRERWWRSRALATSTSSSFRRRSTTRAGTTPDIMLMSPSCYAAFLSLMD